MKKISKNLTYCNPLTLSPSPRKRGEGWGEGGGVKGRICILGGSQVYSWFLKHKLIDEIFLTIEPLVFGTGLPLFDTRLKVPQTYKLVSAKRLNDSGTLIIHYRK